MKVGAGTTVVASGLDKITGCATTETAQVTTPVYPSLLYPKIQPPKEGCLIGFFEAPDPSFYSARNAEIGITYIEKALDAIPYIYSLPWPKSWQTLKEIFKDPYWIMGK